MIKLLYPSIESIPAVSLTLVVASSTICATQTNDLFSDMSFETTTLHPQIIYMSPPAGPFLQKILQCDLLGRAGQVSEVLPIVTILRVIVLWPRGGIHLNPLLDWELAVAMKPPPNGIVTLKSRHPTITIRCKRWVCQLQDGKHLSLIME